MDGPGFGIIFLSFMSNIRLKPEQKQAQFECFLAMIPKVRQAPIRI